MEKPEFIRTIPGVVDCIEPQPRKKRKQQQEHPEEPTSKQMEEYEQHVMENLGTERHTSHPQFKYADGYMRNFGQSYKVKDEQSRVARSRSGQTFIYEGRREKTSFIRRPKRDDTRSLYDDPALQLQRQTNQNRKMVKTLYKDKDDVGCQWEPLLQQHQIPRSYYQEEKYEEAWGPTNFDTTKVQSEYDAFKLFFDDEVYGIILKNTRERYYERYLDRAYNYCHGYMKTKPNYVEWSICERELDGYFAILLFYGIVRLSKQEDYWRKCKRKPNRDPYLQHLESRVKIQRINSRKQDIYAQYVEQRMANIMSRERFKEVKEALNITSNASRTAFCLNDPIWKVRNFLKVMNGKFQQYYKPDEYITVDEGMIPFNGRVAFKVFNPDKPTPWGIKEYLICDALRCYTFEIRIYHGQTTWDNEVKPTEDMTPTKTMELVLQLLKPYENKGHKVIMDNYYTSCQLLRELRTRKIGALGTIRHNRTGLTKADVQQPHFLQIYKDNYTAHAAYINQQRDLILLYFQGTSDKEVALISNYLDHSLNQDHKFNIAKNHLIQPHPRQPYMLYLYNKYRGGVDRRNAFVMNYRSRFPVRKWWEAVFQRLFETAMLNAFLIYKCLYPETMLHRKGLIRDFRINVMHTFAQRYKDWLHQVREGLVKEDRNKGKLLAHNIIKGHRQLPCVDCGKTTRYFCQECTIVHARVLPVCSEDQSMKCYRFHEMDQFNLDRNKVVIDPALKIYKKDNYERYQELKRDTERLLQQKFQDLLQKQDIHDVKHQMDLLMKQHVQDKQQIITNIMRNFAAKKDEWLTVGKLHDSDSSGEIHSLDQISESRFTYSKELVIECSNEDIPDRDDIVDFDRIYYGPTLYQHKVDKEVEKEEEGEDKSELKKLELNELLEQKVELIRKAKLEEQKAKLEQLAQKAKLEQEQAEQKAEITNEQQLHIQRQRRLHARDESMSYEKRINKYHEKQQSKLNTPQNMQSINLKKDGLSLKMITMLYKNK